MKKSIKAFFLLILISFLFCFSLSAQQTEKNIRWFTPGIPSLSAQWAFSLPFKGDVRNPAPSEDFIVAADFGELRVDSGIKYQFEQLDLTNRVIYMPTFHNAFQAGLGLTWHFYRYINVFTENDVILSARFRWIKGPVFSFENAFGLLFKYAVIDAIKADRSGIFNLSYQVEILCNWKLFQRSDFWFAINLQDYFDYPLAISPFFKLGLDFEATPGLVLGLDYSLKFVDMFYSAVYLNESILRFTFKVVL